MEKKKIYTITYASYDEWDNHLESDVRTTDNRISAINLYEEWRYKAKTNAIGEDEEYDVGQVETSLTEHSRKYQVDREVGTDNGYQAVVELSVTEL